MSFLSPPHAATPGLGGAGGCEREAEKKQQSLQSLTKYAELVWSEAITLELLSRL